MPSVVGMDGIRKNQTMMMPCVGEQLVIGFRLHEIAHRRQQFQPHEKRRDTADHKEYSDGRDIEQRDALVVGSEQP